MFYKLNGVKPQMFCFNKFTVLNITLPRSHPMVYIEERVLARIVKRILHIILLVFFKIKV